MIEQHLESWSEKLPHSVAEILRSLYDDDRISGGLTITKAKELKGDAVTIFSDTGFELHKWHSNAPDLEEYPRDCVNAGEDTYAKQQLSANVSGEGSKLLGLRWDKVADTLAITFPQERVEPTKRGILGKLARVYDPLALATATTLQGKFIYREACELKQAWDAPLADAVAVRWKRWESDLPENQSMQWRSMHLERQADVVSQRQCTQLLDKTLEQYKGWWLQKRALQNSD